MSNDLIQQQSDKTRRQFEIERDLVRDVMDFPVGRRFIMSQITPTLFTASYTPGDPLATAFNEGRRSFVLELLARVDQVAPELLLEARREEIDRAVATLIERKTQPPQEMTNG